LCGGGRNKSLYICERNNIFCECGVCVWAARLVRHVIPVYFVDTKDIYTYLYIRSHMYIYSCGTVIRVRMKEQEFIRVVLTGDIYIYVYMQQVCGHRRHMYMCT